MNVVSLIGNLATDVELRELAEEKRVASFLLAVDRATDGADFIRIAVWDKQADACVRFLTKGKLVAVYGRLRSRSWQDADGSRRAAVEVVANSVEFLWRPEEQAAETPFEAAAAS